MNLPFISSIKPWIRSSLSWVICFLPIKIIAQKPHGFFVQKETTIGQPIQFSLSYRHSPTDEILFPDSSYNFSPFEFKGIQLFTTQTDARGSLDSVVYTITSYEIQPIKTFALPIQTIGRNDTTFIFSEVDSIRYLETIPDSLLQKTQLQNDTYIPPLQKEIDLWRFSKYFMYFSGIVGIVILLFGKRIFRMYKLFFYTRKHRDFTLKFKKYIKESNTIESIHQALLLWKNHMQWLENKPFNSFTTKEILDTIPNERLGEALREMDMAIYGGVLSQQMAFAMNKLLETANELYRKQKDEYADRLKGRTT